MTSLSAIRAGKPAFYPDQTVYAEFCARALGLRFAELDGGTGLVFAVSSAEAEAVFGAGRGSFFAQNTATATSLAHDKYFANLLMARADIPTLGGDYFFLHDRHRAHRAPGHERSDALCAFEALGGCAFVKPLNGSRGDYAGIVTGTGALDTYLDDVAGHYDAVIMQRVARGDEYRVFVLDDEILYVARKLPPAVTGDGIHSLRELIARADAALGRAGVSAHAADPGDTALDHVPAQGARVERAGRMNLSAGGSMQFAELDHAAQAISRRAVRVLGLRAGAVDLFTDLDDDAETLRIIEVNANPSIRFLEQAGRADLILRIWRHTFTSLGLIDV